VRPRSFAESVLEGATADLDVRETGYNTGPRVDQMLRNLGLSPGQPWCAAAVTTWIREAAERTGMEAPIAGSALAQEVGRQLQQAGRWFDVGELGDARETLRPGMVVVWYRGPREEGKGHIGLVERVIDEQRFETIEGNSGDLGDGVWRRQRETTNPLLLGAGWLDDGITLPEDAPEAEAEPSLASISLALCVGMLGGYIATRPALWRRIGHG